jgi:TolA-binding protein
MKQFFVLGLAILSSMAGSGCATRGYARRQAAKVNDRTSQVQAQVTALSAKHDTDISHVNERLTTADNKLQEVNASAAQANISAAHASANAARADATASQASASAARADATIARAEATTARAEAAAARERAVIAQNTTADRSKLATTLPATGSPLPLVALSGFFSLGAAGALRLLRR